MNVQCTHCSTVFRVDPRKVPAAGVRVRCSICRGVFDLSASSDAAPRQPQAMQQAAPQPAEATVPAAAPVAAPAPQPGPAAAPSPAPAAPTPAPQPTPAPASVPAPTPAPPAPRPATAAPQRSGSPFGSSDPDAKARRLARALVSDIVTYHPERRDQALANGTLKREFLEEIKKSWEEYVGQVGNDTAKSTPHFREALNQILAKGQAVF
ncbi:MAG TPA: zinc-ribbon domain-containing protein [Longimicrobium sp.]|jgi:predicted Zn finger-like uncharacterized protein|uniref:zinc-ribbon domain-containing protein n=1 Tax=Longimicrobium sp. TaxID=2029185 RepID=UPI002EDB5EE5